MPLFWFQTQLLTPSHSKEVLLCIKHNKYCGTERVIEVFWAKYHKRLCWPIILIWNVRRRGACLPKRGQVPAHRTSCGSQMLRLCAKSNKTSPNSWCAFHVLVLMSPITSGETYTSPRVMGLGTHAPGSKSSYLSRYWQPHFSGIYRRVLFYLLFQDRVSLCNLSCLGARFIGGASLTFTAILLP